MTQIEFFDKDAVKNILAVLSIKPEKVVYLYDSGIKDMNYFLSLEKCFRRHIPQIILEKIPVENNSVQDIYEKTINVINNNKDCIMELTGGSELMMIGGFKAGNEKGIKMVHTDIISGKIVDVNDNSKSFNTTTLNLQDFVDAKGACFVGASHDEPMEEKFDSIIEMCKMLFKNIRNWKNTCIYFQVAATYNYRDDMKFEGKPVYTHKDGKKYWADRYILQEFERLGFIKNLRITAKEICFSFAYPEAKVYLTNYGLWLEMYVFISAKKAGQFEDVRLGAMIDWNAYDGVSVAGNEIDVIIMEKSMPVFVSCKMRNIDTSALNELLINKKRLGGWFSKCILVTTSEEKKVCTGAYKRANELGIEILDRDDLKNNEFQKILVNTIKGHDLVNLKWTRV